MGAVPVRMAGSRGWRTRGVEAQAACTPAGYPHSTADLSAFSSSWVELGSVG